MQCGIFHTPYNPPSRTPRQVFDWSIDIARIADEAGYTDFMIGEHYTLAWENIPMPEAIIGAASTHGPWTMETLGLIDAHPATLSTDIAALVGRERKPFKTDVRKLKELGLTESLEVGYRLSPRGRTYLARTER